MPSMKFEKYASKNGKRRIGLVFEGRQLGSARRGSTGSLRGRKRARRSARRDPRRTRDPRRVAASRRPAPERASRVPAATPMMSSTKGRRSGTSSSSHTSRARARIDRSQLSGRLCEVRTTQSSSSDRDSVRADLAAPAARHGEIVDEGTGVRRQVEALGPAEVIGERAGPRARRDDEPGQDDVFLALAGDDSEHAAAPASHLQRPSGRQSARRAPAWPTTAQRLRATSSAGSARRSAE